MRGVEEVEGQRTLMLPSMSFLTGKKALEPSRSRMD